MFLCALCASVVSTPRHWDSGSQRVRRQTTKAGEEADRNMKVTVGICTWNRAKLLDLSLGRMISMRVPDGVTWELLVVNNNSTDDTEKVLASYEDRLPLRTFFEAAPGKSNALNRAVGEAQGDLIIWTDDDVLVDSGWLAALCGGSGSMARRGLLRGPHRTVV